MPNAKNGPTPRSNGEPQQLNATRGGLVIGNASYAINERNQVPSQRPASKSDVAGKAFGLK